MTVVDRESIRSDYRRDRRSFQGLLAAASAEDLRGHTDGTRWTNEELLFHMLFGYHVVRVLLPLVRLFAVLPPQANRWFAALLDASTKPFDLINYLGARWGARVIDRRRMMAVFDWTLAALLEHLDTEPEEHMARGTMFPTRWDPFFKSRMTIADVYRYPTQHFAFHREQLTIGSSPRRR